MSSILDAALEGLSLGIWPTPVRSGEKAPYLSGWQGRRIEADALAEFFSANGDSDSLGWLWGIPPAFAADVDCDSSETVSAAALIKGPPTGRIFGPSEAPYSHYLFTLPEEFKGETFRDPVVEAQPVAERKLKSTLVEIRGRGQQTVIPPSPYKDGRVRVWKAKSDFGQTTYEALRDWVVKIASCGLLARYWPNRTSARMALAGMLLRAQWTEEQASEFVVAVTRISQPDDREARANARTVVSTCYDRLQRGEEVMGRSTLEERLGENGSLIVRAAAGWLRIESDRFPSTDGENADRYADQHAQDLRFCTEQRIWYAWDGQRWQRDAIGEVWRRARETAETIWNDARKTSDEKKKKARSSWAIHSDSRSGLESMIAIARFDRRIEAQRFADTFDREPMLLNCQSGIVNLETGEVSPWRREAMMTKMAPVACDEKCDTTGFRAYVRKTFDSSEEMINFAQEWGGYCLTGSTGEQAIFLVCGPSGTSKSTWVKLLHGMMGDYAVQIPSKVLLEKPAHAKDYDTALLAGARLATTIETSPERKLDEEAIKAMTGQDILRGERKYEHSFDFRSQAKLILATNYRPVVRETDDAIWRRIKPIPFLVTVPETERVDGFEEKLIEKEGPGILAWFVAGAVRWKKDGKLTYPAEVTEAASAYRAEQDEVQEFLDECCQVDGSALTSKAAVYAEYAAHARKGNLRPMSKKRFGMEMGRIGYEEGSGRDKVKWAKIRFNAQVQKAIDERALLAEAEAAEARKSLITPALDTT